MWEKIKNWLVKTLDFDRDGKVTAEDIELARTLAEDEIKKANEAINKAATETKKRAGRVKEEVTDVVETAKETIDQVEDVIAAAKGKERKGRKKK